MADDKEGQGAEKHESTKEANCYVVMDMQSYFELQLAGDHGEQLAAPVNLKVADSDTGCLGVLPVYSSIDEVAAIFGEDTQVLPAYIKPKDGGGQDERGQQTVVEGAEGSGEIQLRMFVPQ